MSWELLERIGLVFMIAAFIALGVLGYKQYSQNQEVLRRLSVVEVASPCDETCVRQLVSEAIATISSITKPQKQEVIDRVVQKVTMSSASSGSRTQYVSLGGGQTTDTDWTDIPGAEITFNTKDFGTIASVYFEAQLKSPAGLVSTRLWDKTANTIVQGSEISHIAGDAKLVSSIVVIPTGGRTLIVQLRSETEQPVQVVSSRLRIDTK